MNQKTIHVLLAIVVGLLLLLFVTRGIDHGDTGLPGELLLPDLRAAADSIDRVQVIRADAEDGATVYRKAGTWVVSDREDYPADVGKLRQIIIALADAKLVEEKTSNPDLYEKIGVDDPSLGGDGVKLVITGPDVSATVILGDAALGDYRYARVADKPTSYLINKNPDVPNSAADWLLPDIVDVDASDIRRVTIAHADGETLVIEKSEQEQTDFDVLAIPEGRELSYATVANGIAGALNSLELQDVRAAVDAPSTTITTFETWDGMQITVGVIADNDISWLTLNAELANEESTASDKVADINERVTGWQYQVADYKKNLLVRRWEDILKESE